MNNGMKLDVSFFIAVLVILIIGINNLLTVERSLEPKLYCWYNENDGVVVYEYECLSTNEFLTDQDEVFSYKSCVTWEDYHGKWKKEKNITK